MGGAFGQFGGIDPVSVYDRLHGPSELSPYGQHWIATTKVNYAWTLVGYTAPWSVDHNDPNRTIAIIDTGIDTSHPEFFGDEELPSKIHPASRSFVEGGNGFGAGFCDCIAARYDIDDVEDTLWMYNVNPHGTIVAGIAGAYAENGEGIAGVCWDCSLLVLHVSVIIPAQTACGSPVEGCTYSARTVSDAIKYAAGWNPDDDTWGTVRARVICTALEGAGFYLDVCDGSGLVAEAVDEAFGRGCVVVAIAGNDPDAYAGPCWSTTDPDEPNCAADQAWVPDAISSPLAFDPRTITVGGACRSGSAWHCQSKINPPIEALGSCGSALYPVRPLDNTAPVLSIVAPIEDMVVTVPDEDYAFLGEYNTGTSWAAPQVAGIVALMLKMNPALSPAEVKYILEVTATD
ncbi:MAG: hypothetical protein DYG94_15000, partial [Leptolyngbya sp. PLA3]